MRRLVLLPLLCAAIGAGAQSTQANLETRLRHKPLYLRGLYADDALSFDTAGRLEGTSPLTPFTLSGVEIDKVQLTPTRLRLQGRRVGLRFKHDLPQRLPIDLPRDHGFGTQDEKIVVQIETPQTGDFGPALDAIFTNSIADLVPSMPDEWQKYALQHFVAPPVVPKAEATPDNPAHAGSTLPAPSPGLRKIGGSVAAPVVLKQPEPEFTLAARGSGLAGDVLVYLQVDQEGKPTHVQILHPLGLGLDENALLAVESYQFKPAMENGHPVAVELNVKVAFEIY